MSLQISEETLYSLPKNIFLLWLQGWDKAPWLQKQVAESWTIQNPGWTIHYIDAKNLSQYTNDIAYIYEPKKRISPQALSDIIRLSLLNRHGGVWADSTMLCMQPLDNWVYESVKPSQLWMYHGPGGGLKQNEGPASWLIVSQPRAYMIKEWKYACDRYWGKNTGATHYFWMDHLFVELLNTDIQFRHLWYCVPNICCELDGQSHTLAHHKMDGDTPHIKELLRTNPPYALKMWKGWSTLFPDITTESCIQSNGYCAIQLSKRTP